MMLLHYINVITLCCDVIRFMIYNENFFMTGKTNIIAKQAMLKAS